jgi:hypothetical protein
MATSTRNKNYFGRTPSPVKGKRVVKKAKAKAPTKASVKTNGNANATNKKKNAGVSHNVFNMPLSDSAAAIDAASTCYHINHESKVMGGLSQETMDNEELLNSRSLSRARA